MIIVHYEVYLLEGRGWMLHARFPRTEREAAITEAKELETTLNVRVKVIRETYYTDTNAFDEAEVYISGGKAAGKSKPAPAKGQARAASAPTSYATQSPAKTAQRKPPPPPRPTRKPARSEEDSAHARQFLARLLAVTAVALAVALLSIKLTPEVIVLAWKLGFSLTVTPDAYSQLLIAVFALTFLMTAVPLGMKFLPRNPRVNFHRPAFAFNRGSASPKPSFDPALKRSLDKLANKALREQEEMAEVSEPEPEPEPEPPDLEDLPPILPGPDEMLPDILPDAAAPPPEPAAEDNFADPVPQARHEDEPAGDEKKPASAISAESQMPAVTKFVNGAMEAARMGKVALDAYNKFALHLYMAGAVESLCDFRKMSGPAKLKLMNAALDTLGTRGEMASSFYDKLPEYRREARYAGVLEAGRGAMGNYLLGDEAGAHLALTEVFRDWNKKTTEKKAQMMTVMFTDMVGSTDLTQARGDAAAQEIVRRHNLIVRSTLQQFNGHEVKHTGDGIMASFLSASDAVSATMQIQRQVNQHNTRQPNQPLHLRIGLNAGEPIQEEDDLFGSTVQLSARVCAATDSDETLCTDSVRELCGDKPALTFKHIGNKYLKGFKEAIPLYQVPWK